MRLVPAFDGCSVTFVSTIDPGRSVGDARTYIVPDAHRGTKWQLLRVAAALFRVIVRERPDIVISTGAAPGYLALRIGRLLGARTVWIDSIANVDELSMSGRLALSIADLTLTQWSHLARPNGPVFVGSVI